MLALLALLLQDPVIERSELVTGGAFRGGRWAPLEVRIRSAGEIRAELAVRTDVGWTIVQSIRAGPGLPDPVVPVLALFVNAPLEVVLRQDGKELSRLRRSSLGRGLYDSELLIAGPGTPDERAVYFSADVRGMRLEWLEAVDAIVGTAPPGYETMGGIVAETLPEALEKLQRRGKPSSRWFGPADIRILEQAPMESWVETRRMYALWFVLLYLLAGMLALASALRWIPRWSWALAAGIAASGSLVLLLTVPKGSVSVTRRTCDHGDARLSVYFVRRSPPGPIDVVFPHLVKPVYPTPDAAGREPFELRIEGGASRVTGLTLGEGDVRVFTAVDGGVRTDPLEASILGDRATVRGTLYGAGATVEGRWASFGDVNGSASAPLVEGRGPEDPVARYFVDRLARGAPAIYGYRSRRAVPGGDVQGPEVVEVRDLPGLVLQELR